MSEISASLLSTDHKGVHEQFDMLASAMQVQVIANSREFRGQIVAMPERDREKWFKSQLDIAMSSLGHRPGFLMRRLLVYVYQLYEQFYISYTQALPFKVDTSLVEVQQTILPLASSFLDLQFERERVADICLFLKQDPRLAFASR